MLRVTDVIEHTTQGSELGKIQLMFRLANCDLIDGSTHGSKLRNVPLMFDTAGPQDKQRTVGPRLAHSATQTVPTITANTFYKAEKYILQF